MAGKILIADRDKTYAQALALRIQKHCTDQLVESVSDDSSFIAAMHASQIPSLQESITLIVSESHFPTDNLPVFVCPIILLHGRNRSFNSTQADFPVRMGSVVPILQKLDQFRIRSSKPGSYVEESQVLQGNGLLFGDADTPPVTAKALSTGTVGPQKIQQEMPPRIILILTQTTSGRFNHYADQRCSELTAKGTRIYYLPLMPNYYCRQWTVRESGFGLSDLLLRLGTGGLSAQDLGVYSAIDPVGRFQFRPTDRADDLLHCRIEDLYRLSALLRERIESESEAILVIEAVGIAYRHIRAIMPLCDRVEVIIPEGSDFAAEALRREISEALSDLPSITQVVRISERMALSMLEPSAAQRRRTNAIA
jgi:hypothetical protein